MAPTPRLLQDWIILTHPLEYTRLCFTLEL